MKRSLRIADLIVAFIKGEISQDDLAVLDEWLDESEENKALFVSFMDEAVFEEEKKGYAPEKLETVFARIKARAKKMKIRRQIRFFTVAAASVAVFFSVFMVIQYREARLATPEASVIAVGKQIAYLQLASGERIELKESQKDTIRTGEKCQQIILNNGRVEIENLGENAVNEEEYNVMEVPRGAEYKLILPDGTKVWLNADSKLKFPTRFNTSQRYVELSGEAYFEVTRDEMRPFIVHSGEADIRVLGTEFCIRNYADRPTLTTLVKGSVEVTDYRGYQVILKPGQQAVTSEMSTVVREVETIYYTSWKEGYFIFENTPLDEIMEELSLWYNCQYFFVNGEAANIRITARLKKYDEIDVLLGILSKTNEIKMEKKENAILIRQK